MNTYYHYSGATGEVLGSTHALIDPLETEKAGEDVYMRPPAYATTEPPPDRAADQAAVFIDGTWSLVPDYRGVVYYLADGSKHIVTKLNEKPPAEALLALPDGIALDRAKEAKVAELKAACSAAVRGGFVSAALGSDHRYDTDKTEDQVNLIGAGNAGADIKYTCTEVTTGIKSRRLHTAAQMAQVLADGIAQKDAYIDLLHARLAAVSAISMTADLGAALTEIDAVTW